MTFEMTPAGPVVDGGVRHVPEPPHAPKMSMAAPVPAPVPPSAVVASTAVAKALYKQIQVDHEVCDAGDEDSFFVCDLGEIRRAFAQWQHQLPMVKPYYAVKCNPHFQVVKLLGQLGANFDCASKAEIDEVLSLGFSPDQIVYANPCKTNSFIRHSQQVGVKLTTVDNTTELHKLARFHPKCGVLVRLTTDDSAAQCRLSTKFGCTVDEAIGDILPLARQLGLNVRGVAFHVGSGAKDFTSINTAMKDSRQVIDAAVAMGFQVDTLDIGGGFERATFAESSAMVRASLDQYFAGSDINVIAEPGRFMVSDAFTLAAHVIAKRPHEVPMVYINDGVYGNMNCILFDHQTPEAHVLVHRSQFVYGDSGVGSFKCSIWGPTCDGLDCVSGDASLGWDVDVGDWLYFPRLGAYTSAASTAFNGFSSTTKVVFVDTA
ncbi:ornithine decarboxylase [Diutina rugosa]